MSDICPDCSSTELSSTKDGTNKWCKVCGYCNY